MTNAPIAERLGGRDVLRHDIRTDLELVEALQEGFPWASAKFQVVAHPPQVLGEMSRR